MLVKNIFYVLFNFIKFILDTHKLIVYYESMNTQTYIKNIRTQLKINQTEFGELVNRKQSVISRWESGKIQTPGNMILKIQKILSENNYNTKK